MSTVGSFKEIWRAFRRQNSSLMWALTRPERLSIKPYVEHHAGGLLVAGKDQESRVPGEVFYCKMHDSWGPPEDGGPIVVHLYDPHAEDVAAHDVGLYFDNGSQAIALFHNDEALAAIWEVTR